MSSSNARWSIDKLQNLSAFVLYEFISLSCKVQSGFIELISMRIAERGRNHRGWCREVTPITWAEYSYPQEGRQTDKRDLINISDLEERWKARWLHNFSFVTTAVKKRASDRKWMSMHPCDRHLYVCLCVWPCDCVSLFLCVSLCVKACLCLKMMLSPAFRWIRRQSSVTEGPPAQS